MTEIHVLDLPFVRGLVKNSRRADWPAIEALYSLDPGTLQKIHADMLWVRWSKEAQAGSWRSLLAIYRVRVMLMDNLCSDRLPAPGERLERAGDVPREVWKQARAFLRLRTDRRDARAIAADARIVEEGRIIRLWREKLHELAVEKGYDYHRRVKPLYQSERGAVVYGRGGIEQSDDNAYSEGYRKKFGGAKWKDAGARLDDENRPTCIILENHRGTEVARVSLRKEV